jgi:hypothetical protein
VQDDQSDRSNDEDFLGVPKNQPKDGKNHYISNYSKECTTHF